MNTQADVLLIEDNSNDAEMTIRALKKNNFVNKIVHLPDGAAALDYLFGQGAYLERNTEITPKLILLDLKMPKINGIEVLKKIKSSESTKTIPVVVLTSSKEDPDIAECYALGVNSYVVKPLEFDEFVKAIAHLGLYWMLLNQSPH